MWATNRLNPSLSDQNCMIQSVSLKTPLQFFGGMSKQNKVNGYQKVLLLTIGCPCL